MNISMFEFGL